MYLDCLSLNLSASNFGCKYVDKTVNHLMFADDLTLVAPSAKGLQTLLLPVKSTLIHMKWFIILRSLCLCECTEAKHHKPMHIPSLILKNDFLQMFAATSILVIP